MAGVDSSSSVISAQAGLRGVGGRAGGDEAGGLRPAAAADAAGCSGVTAGVPIPAREADRFLSLLGVGAAAAGLAAGDARLRPRPLETISKGGSFSSCASETARAALAAAGTARDEAGTLLLDEPLRLGLLTGVLWPAAADADAAGTGG